MENRVNPEIVMNKACSQDSEHREYGEIENFRINLEILIRFRLQRV